MCFTYAEVAHITCKVQYTVFTMPEFNKVVILCKNTRCLSCIGDKVELIPTTFLCKLSPSCINTLEYTGAAVALLHYCNVITINWHPLLIWEFQKEKGVSRAGELG